MDRNKIKFKYLMNVWKSLPDYPTEEDITYELSLYLVKDGRPNGEFTMQTFNSAFGQDWAKTKHGEVIQSMLDNGSFVDTGSKNAGNTKYRLKVTPDYCK